MFLHLLLDTSTSYLATTTRVRPHRLAAGRPPITMESSSRDHGRSLKQLPPWTTTTTTPAGHSFSLAAGCFSWPPQQRSLPSSSSYTCGYCRREFRSAQALGGHMNVHRRDRARLRQCCSAHHPASSSLTSAHQHRAPLPNLNLSPPHCAGSMAAAEPVIYSFFSTTTTSAAAAATKAALEVSLELGIGVCGRGNGNGRGGAAAVEDNGLDLELRLGCAWE